MSREWHGLWSSIMLSKHFGYESYKLLDSYGRTRLRFSISELTHKEIALQVIVRYCRIFKKLTVGEYNAVVKRVCERIYSNWHNRGAHLMNHARKDCFPIMFDGGTSTFYPCTKKKMDDEFVTKRTCHEYKDEAIRRRDRWRLSEKTRKLGERWGARKDSLFMWEFYPTKVAEMAWAENKRFDVYQRVVVREEYRQTKKDIRELNKLIKSIKQELKNECKQNQNYSENINRFSAASR